MANKAAKLEIQVDAETKSAVKDLDKVAAAVDDISAAATDAGSALDGIASGAADAAAAAGDSFGGIVPVFDVTAVLGKVGELASKAGAFFADQFSKAMEFEVGTDKLQVQLNLTTDQAAKAGKLAGDIYAEAWGDSIADVNEGLASVIRNIGIAPDAPNLKAITTQVLAIADAFDVDLSGATRAAGALMKTGLAANAEEAMDIITKGLQTSSGEAEDFLEAITESSANLKTFGFTGKQAIGLINQGMKAGAENADAITGLFEELVGNVASGGDELTEVFNSLGIDSKKVIDQLAAGGPDAAAGIDTLIDAIRDVEDPLKRSAAIAALFGEEGAALQQVLLNLDPSNAVDALGQVEGAAQGAADALGDNAAGKFEAFKRSLGTNVTQFIVDNVIPGLNTLGTEANRIFAEMGIAWDSFVRGFQGIDPMKLEVDDGQLTSSIGAVEEANQGIPDNPTLQMFRDLGEEARKLTDEWGPKLLQFWRDLQTEAQKSAAFLRDNKDLLETVSAIIQGVAVVAFLALAAAIGLVVLGLSLLMTGLFLLTLPFVGIAIVLNRFEKTWLDVWKGALDVISRIGQQIGEVIETIEDAIGGLIRTLESFARRPWDFLSDLSLPGIGGNAVAPSMITPMALGVSPMAAGSTGRAAPVFNVTVQHSGLAVDSPRLQREIVDALRRWQKREGPLRGIMS